MQNSTCFSMPNTRFVDIAPAAGGEPYRIFLYVPKGEAPEAGWPLLVTTDGNATFPFAASSLVTQAPYPTGTNVGWGVIAAIGYPTDEPYDAMRRAWDLGPPPSKTYPPYHEGGPPVVIGGTGDLLDFIEAQLLPAIEAIAPIDPQRRSLFGHSFGGLFVLYALFARPGLFKNWIAASPTIYWEGSEILNDEARRAMAPGNAPFLHLSAGEYEGDRWRRSNISMPMPRVGSKSARRSERSNLRKRWPSGWTIHRTAFARSSRFLPARPTCPSSVRQSIGPSALPSPCVLRPISPSFHKHFCRLGKSHERVITKLTLLVLFL